MFGTAATFSLPKAKGKEPSCQGVTLLAQTTQLLATFLLRGGHSVWGLGCHCGVGALSCTLESCVQEAQQQLPQLPFGVELGPREHLSFYSPFPRHFLDIWGLSLPG